MMSEVCLFFLLNFCVAHTQLLQSSISLQSLPTRLLCPWNSVQEYWSELPCPPPGNLPNPGIEPRFPTLQADSFPSEPPRSREGSNEFLLRLWKGIQKEVFATQGNAEGMTCQGEEMLRVKGNGTFGKGERIQRGREKAN